MPELGPVDKYSSWRYDGPRFHAYAIIHVLPTQVPGRSSLNRRDSPNPRVCHRNEGGHA